MWRGANKALDAGLITLGHMGKPLGATFIGISIMVLVIGVNRFVLSSLGFRLNCLYPAFSPLHKKAKNQ